jgi:3D (Asp-Asp-Asp) domain-containing protein
MVVVGTALLAIIAAVSAGPAAAEESKLEKERIEVSDKGPARGKHKLCCGYPLTEELGFALRFYWLAEQENHDGEYDEVDIYTRDGFFFGVFPAHFIDALKMEGSGVLDDGRVVNYHGRCSYGQGTCFEELDQNDFPYGRGAGARALVPFKSVAVDPSIIPIGETIYIPELDGLLLPDGSIHDGCVRADDTGGAIKRRKMDFFVISQKNFRYLNSELHGDSWITPQIEHPRCDYLRDG